MTFTTGWAVYPYESIASDELDALMGRLGFACVHRADTPVTFGLIGSGALNIFTAGRTKGLKTLPVRCLAGLWVWLLRSSLLATDFLDRSCYWIGTIAASAHVSLRPISTFATAPRARDDESGRNWKAG